MVLNIKQLYLPHLNWVTELKLEWDYNIHKKKEKKKWDSDNIFRIRHRYIVHRCQN
jgi:hypothetical protein